MNDAEDFTIKVDSDDRIINALADRIRSEDAGLDYDDIPAMADLLSANAYARLLVALNICLIHTVSNEICIEKNLPCQEIDEEWT